MTSLEINFKDTSTFRVSFESCNVSFVSVLAMVHSENWKRQEGFSFKFHHFYEIAEIIFFLKFSSSLFQYSERTIASTETNYTSAESPGPQHFLAP